MSFKPLDRSVVRTKDLMLDDGQSYDQYYDPMTLAARNMWKDIKGYELKAGTQVENIEGLKVTIPSL